MAVTQQERPEEEQPWAEFRLQLLATGLLLATGVDGLYGRSETYEAVADAVDRLVLRVGVDQGALEHPVSPGHAMGHVRAQWLPRVLPRPDGVHPHLPR